VDTITTERLHLRPWSESDVDFFVQMNTDPEVVEYLPSPISEKESQQFVRRIQAHFTEYGYGLYALERREDAAFLGYTGLHWALFESPFTPALEVGWRLARHAWGRGYATEAARACMTHAFVEKGISEIVSFTVPANTRSAAVMKRLGMTRNPAEDFIHPRLGPDHPLGQHILYRVHRSEWDGLRANTD
jgi:RimJ/RimL family protein N-acetyltransferase